jgi:hypothetical protein
MSKIEYVDYYCGLCFYLLYLLTSTCYLQAPKENRHRYGVFLQCSMYEKQIRTPPTAAEIPSILAQFHTRPIDEKFDSDDIIRPGSGVSGGGNSPSAAAVASAAPLKPAAPPPRPPPPGGGPPRYVVTFDYDNTVEEGMMAIKIGDELNVTDKSDADWWNATKLNGPQAGESGWIPAAYVKRM